MGATNMGKGYLNSKSCFSLNCCFSSNWCFNPILFKTPLTSKDGISSSMGLSDFFENADENFLSENGSVYDIQSSSNNPISRSNNHYPHGEINNRSGSSEPFPDLGIHMPSGGDSSYIGDTGNGASSFEKGGTCDESGEFNLPNPAKGNDLPLRGDSKDQKSTDGDPALGDSKNQKPKDNDSNRTHSADSDSAHSADSDSAHSADSNQTQPPLRGTPPHIAALWVQCEDCLGLNYKRFLKDRNNMCEHCPYHFKMNSPERIEFLIDPNTWDPIDEDMASPDPDPYESDSKEDHFSEDEDPIGFDLEKDTFSEDPSEWDSEEDTFSEDEDPIGFDLEEDTFSEDEDPIGFDLEKDTFSEDPSEWDSEEDTFSEDEDPIGFDLEEDTFSEDEDPIGFDLEKDTFSEDPSEWDSEEDTFSEDEDPIGFDLEEDTFSEDEDPIGFDLEKDTFSEDPSEWDSEEDTFSEDEDPIGFDLEEDTFSEDEDPIGFDLEKDTFSEDPSEWDSEEENFSKDPSEWDSEEEKGKSYEDRLDSYRRKTGLNEAVQTGVGQLNGIPAAFGIMEFEFMGGSMGSVVGEKIARLVEYATNQSLPLVIVCASGGARVQEGSLSLMQMAKISSALLDYDQSNNKLLYISILASPTTGGVTASFGTLADIIIAEPNSYIAFAGKRVIEETLKEPIPEGSQEAEPLFEKGILDLIIPRKLLKDVLTEFLKFHGLNPLNSNSIK
uniref:Acetyl-coenzyme A carboxylase carboxyl transferase subunit beta, chloroplastic n=1 Tax=Adenocalymma nodosum TaxID=2099428 RepID=A0A2P1G9E4_9LAMI|nr:acetyl-CoA carboxylase carboxyltransferase beta subunit [Adenocalymma nodosum]AVM81576.1 acetyl-CoA carboxylase carboxyltransferase beta subunit [Adenocalymma nodosum]